MRSELIPLFEPIRVGALHLPNRIVMAPLTRSRAHDGNVPHSAASDYYSQRASAGLIVAEATQVSDTAQGYPSTPGIHTGAQVKAWSTVTDAVHQAGGRIVLQLWHVGRVSHPIYQPGGRLPVAPSALAAPEQTMGPDGSMLDFPVPRALDEEEIFGYAAEFASAAKRARDAGFDGVEIHAANGYLIDQFLRDATNLRSDSYGGSVDNRIRFLREVVEAVAATWSVERIGVRISPQNSFNGMSDRDPQALFTRVAELLGELGVAYLHVIEPIGPHPMASPPGSRPLAPAIREAFDGVLILNGGYTGDLAAEAVASGAADLVSFGAPFIANPDLPFRLRSGAALAPADPATFYGGGEHGYIDYPTLEAIHVA